MLVDVNQKALIMWVAISECKDRKSAMAQATLTLTIVRSSWLRSRCCTHESHSRREDNRSYHSPLLTTCHCTCGRQQGLKFLSCSLCGGRIAYWAPCGQIASIHQEKYRLFFLSLSESLLRSDACRRDIVASVAATLIIVPFTLQPLNSFVGII